MGEMNGRDEGEKEGREEGRKEGRERVDEQCDEIFMMYNEVNIVSIYVHTTTNKQ